MDELTPDQLDQQPFGIIKLDESGRIIAYNAYEERLARLSRDEVLGKSFFFDVAPCTRIREFYGRYLDGVSRKSLRTRFEFVFDFAHGQRRVVITLFFRETDETVWVLVQG